jgi:hypothetical protein
MRRKFFGAEPEREKTIENPNNMICTEKMSEWGDRAAVVAGDGDDSW